MIDGIDVASHQGVIQWGAVAGGGISFAVIKSTEGSTYRDPYFPMNWSGAKLAGLVRGAYHFARADLGTSPTAEADFFLDTAPLEVGDFLALDLEDAPGHPQPADLYPWASGFVARVLERAGFLPFIYSTAGYLGAHNLTGKPDLSNTGLWLASWFNRPPANFPPPPPDWPFTAMHQWSDNGRVPGIAGPVDLDRFNGSADQLRLYGKPPPAAAPDRAPLDDLWAALQVCRGEYVTPADVADLDRVSQSIDSIKSRYNFQP